MNRIVPFELFEHVDHPILVADECGRIEFINRCAARLLGCSQQDAIGRACWTVTRLKTPDGGDLCREDCAIREQIRAGRVPNPAPAVRASDGGDPVALQLFTYVVSPSREGRVAILHLLKDGTEAAFESATGAIQGHAELLGLLTPREKEVLERLAEGMTTERIAGSLCVSPSTVRNHIRSILSKLGVHHRIEAVLAWLLSARTAD